MEFFFRLDQRRNVGSKDIEIIEGLMRCCLAIPQILLSVANWLKGKQDRSGFLVFVDYKE
jgi:hypothetical protein